MPRANLQRIDWGKQENTERLLAAILAAQGMKVSFVQKILLLVELIFFFLLLLDFDMDYGSIGSETRFFPTFLSRSFHLRPLNLSPLGSNP